jgi:SAM-dependent methyltransferase
LLGPFAWQGNSCTRAFEYPWVYDQISRVGRKLTIVELGGSLSGMQFVLAAEGHRVINIDPGLDATGVGWNLDLQEHQRLCRVFRAPVEVVPTTIDKANVPDASADIVLSVSAFEHFSFDDIKHAAHQIPRILKPGGVLIFTVDLFLDLEPFTDQISNRWGQNLNVAKFLNDAKLNLVDGKECDLLGYESFTTNSILCRLSELICNPSGPCVAQCVVARSPGK